MSDDQHFLRVSLKDQLAADAFYSIIPIRQMKKTVEKFGDKFLKIYK